MTVSGFDGVDKHVKPEKSLLEVLKKHSGRNSYGRITVRHQGGGNRQKYRVIDFKRNKLTRTAARSSRSASMKTASAATSSRLSA